MIIVVEGIEGVGKSTLTFGLAERLRSDGHDPLVTREPGGTPVGDAVRSMFLDRSIAIAPMTEALLVNAARAQHVADVIRPALAAGRIVLCDRFVDSTLAYQGYGRGLDLTSVRAICTVATGGLEPDLVLLLDGPLDLSRARTQARGGSVDRIEAENDRFHERVRHGFLELAKSPTHCVLDARLPAQEVLESAVRMLHDRMSLWK